MPRDDEQRTGRERGLRFSDREEDGDDLGYSGGSAAAAVARRTTTMTKRTAAGRSTRTPARTCGIAPKTATTMTRKGSLPSK